MMKAGPGRSRPGLGYRRRRVASSPVRYAAAPARPPRAASAAAGRVWLQRNEGGSND